MKKVVLAICLALTGVPALAANSFAFDASGAVMHAGTVEGFSSERVQLLFLQADGAPIERVGSSCKPVTARSFVCQVDGGNPAAKKTTEAVRDAFVEGSMARLRVRHAPTSVLVEVMP